MKYKASLGALAVHSATSWLTSSGFYGSAVEIRSDRSRHPRTLRPLETLASPSVPAIAGP